MNSRSDDNQEKCQSSRDEESDEMSVVSATNAVVEPLAMVISTVHTIVTHPAVT
jgi:hypothetical protein